MDVKGWLAQKLDEPWSSHRLNASLTGDIFDKVGRSVLDLDATTLTRLLLAILYLRPAQIRELQVDIDTFLTKCEEALGGAANSDDYDWALFLIRSLKAFAKDRRIDVDPQRPDLKDYINDLVSTTGSIEIRPYMLPPEAKYLDQSLVPEIDPEPQEHFRVVRPFLFEQESACEPEAVPAQKPTKISPVKSVRPLSRPAGTIVPPPRPPPPPPAKRFVSPALMKKATINRMGLEDVAQLQDRMKRGRPSQDETKRKEKLDMKMKEKAEKEQKRIEERDMKRRKKEDEKEAKRQEKELIKEQKHRALMEQAQQRENEAMDKAAWEAAEAFVRRNSQAMMMAPEHLLAQIQGGMFANPSYPQMTAITPPGHNMPTSAIDMPTNDVDKSPYAGMFIGANALTSANRLLIERFLAGESIVHPEAQNGVLQVILSENYIQDANLDEYLEIVVFEMNFIAGSWRKLKRRKRISQQTAKN